MDAVVEGNCYITGRIEQCCVGIEGGKIVRIAKILDADRRYGFGSKLVLPTAIDAHVHFREPGMTHKEDFASGSTAALHGGVTCVFDMPNTKPPTITPQALKEKSALASAKSLVDFGLFAGLKPGSDVSRMAKDAIGFKLYMASTTGGLLVPSLQDVKAEMDAVARTGKVLAVHAEDESHRRKEVEEGLEDHFRNRPAECELSAIRKVKEVAKACRLHICHVSSRDSLRLITGAQNLTSEVTPHHLLLDKDSRLGALGKVNPPLRARADRQAMMQALLGGAFDIVASDHSPHTSDEKNEDFDYAPSGMPGTETMAPLMLQLVRERQLSIDAFVSKLSVCPGEIFKVPKGRIEVGYDADLMVVDLHAGVLIKADMLSSKCGWTAFEGMPAVFPMTVFMRGEVMMEDGHVVGELKGRDVGGDH